MFGKKIGTIFVATILLISVFSAVGILRASGEEANNKSISESTSKTVEDIDIPDIIVPELNHELNQDLKILGITFSDERPVQGDIVEITATVAIDYLFVEAFDVAFYMDQKDANHCIGYKTVMPSPLEIRTKATLVWPTNETVGYHIIIAVIDPNNKMIEANETNNELSKEICVLTPEFLMNSSINQIKELEERINETINPNEINGYLASAKEHIQSAWEEHNFSRINECVSYLNCSVSEVWEGVEETVNLLGQGKINLTNAESFVCKMRDIDYLIVEATYVTIGDTPVKDIAKAERIIVSIRANASTYMSENSCWEEIDSRLGNATYHYQMALKAVAEQNSPREEIQLAYDELVNAKCEIQELSKGEINTEYANWVADTISRAILIFPPELKVSMRDISVSGKLIKNQKNWVNVTIHNDGVVTARNVAVDVYDNGLLIDSLTISSISAGGNEPRTIEWTPATIGTHYIKAMVDFDNNLVERDKVNNVAENGVYVIKGTQWWNTPENCTITTEIEVTDDTVVVQDYDLVIEGGGHLILKNVTLRIDCEWPGQLSIHVNNGGSFDVLDNNTIPSTVTASVQTLPYKFITHDTLNVSRSIVQWMWGDNITKEEGGIQLFSDSDCRIENSTIYQGYTHNLYIDHCTPKIVNSNISEAGIGDIGHGIYVVNGSSPTIEFCTVNNNTEAGIFVNNSNATIRDNVGPGKGIRDNELYGIYCLNCTGFTPLIEANVIENNTFGICCDESLVVIRGNTICNNLLRGINCTNSSQIIVESNVIHNNTGGGIFCINSSMKISNTSINDSWHGIMPDGVLPVGVYGTDIGTTLDIYNVTLCRNANGIVCHKIANGTINHSKILDNSWDMGGYGLRGDYTSLNISDSEVRGSPECNIFLFHVSGNISFNNISESDCGIETVYSNINVTNNNISNNWFGAYIHNSSGIIANNLISNSDRTGTYLDFSENIIYVNNTVIDNYVGIICEYYEYYRAILIKNIISYNTYGVWCSGASPSIHDNQLLNNSIGVYVREFRSHNSSPNITNNIFLNNSYSIYCIPGTSPNTWIADNQIISSTNCGIYCENASPLINNSTIENSIASGIFCTSYSHPIITNSTIRSNYFGILLSNSTNNNITDCAVYNNSYGIYLNSSSNNTITNCNIYNNPNGIEITEDSSSNYIYHNNIFNNTYQANDSCTNTWNNSYPSGGNYWGDYTGSDLYSGSGQNISGSDGIGDTPYNISGGSNQDGYPLTTPVGSVGPTNLMASKNGSDNITLSWDIVYGATGYNVYRSNYTNGSGPWNLVNETTAPNAVRTGDLADSNNYSYIVKAKYVAGALSNTSNIAFKLCMSILHPGAPNTNWVALPYHCSYANIKALAEAVNPGGADANVSEVRYWDAANQLYMIATYDEIEGWGGESYLITPGMAVYLVAKTTQTWKIVGSHNKSTVINILKPGAPNVNWVSLPYHCSYPTLKELAEAVNPGGADANVSEVRYWDAVNQLYMIATYDEIEGWGGASYSITPGMAVYLVAKTTQAWVPAANDP